MALFIRSDSKVWAENLATHLGRKPTRADIYNLFGFTKYELWIKMRLDAPLNLYQWIDENYICSAITSYKTTRFRDFCRTVILTDVDLSNSIIFIKASDIRHAQYCHARFDEPLQNMPCKSKCAPCERRRFYLANNVIIDWNSIPNVAMFDAPANKRYLFANPDGFQLLHIKSIVSRVAFRAFTKRYHECIELEEECLIGAD